jgi:hypothetical protein
MDSWPTGGMMTKRAWGTAGFAIACMALPVLGNVWTDGGDATPGTVTVNGGGILQVGGAARSPGMPVEGTDVLHGCHARAVPSPRQLNWHKREFYGFLHFTT